MPSNHLTKVAVSGLAGLVLSSLPSGLPQARLSSPSYQASNFPPEEAPAKTPKERALTNGEEEVVRGMINSELPNARFCGMHLYFNSNTRENELSFAYSLPRGLPTSISPNVFVIYNNPTMLTNGTPIITPFKLPDALIMDTRMEIGVFEPLESGVYSFAPSPALGKLRVKYSPDMPKEYLPITESLTIFCLRNRP